MQRKGSRHPCWKLPRRSYSEGGETKSGFKSHLKGVINRRILRREYESDLRSNEMKKNRKFSATMMGTRQHSIIKITDRRKVTPQVSVALKSL